MTRRTFRRPLQQAVVSACTGVIALLVVASAVPSSGFDKVFGSALAAILVLISARAPFLRVTVDARRLRAHNWLGTASAEWRDVAAIEAPIPTILPHRAGLRVRLRDGGLLRASAFSPSAMDSAESYAPVLAELTEYLNRYGDLST